MLSIRDAAVGAWFDSRMCPATLLGNSSVAQELGCWMKQAGYPVQNKPLLFPPPWTSALCSFSCLKNCSKASILRSQILWDLSLKGQC